jgi:CHAT domain-containing protein
MGAQSVPFEALVEDGGYLIERYAMVMSSGRDLLRMQGASVREQSAHRRQSAFRRADDRAANRPRQR